MNAADNDAAPTYYLYCIVPLSQLFDQSGSETYLPTRVEAKELVATVPCDTGKYKPQVDDDCIKEKFEQKENLSIVAVALVLRPKISLVERAAKNNRYNARLNIFYIFSWILS